MLYVFASYLGNDDLNVHRVLNAGGIQRVLERIEELALMQHGEDVQITKENAEALVLSPSLLGLGVTWRWFPERFTFGNGVVRHKTVANYERRTVVSGTDLTQDDYLDRHGSTPLADLRLERVLVQHEGWREYEARWRPGTCPGYSHELHLTWLVTRQPMPPAVYGRVRQIIEEGALPDDLGELETPEEPGRYWSTLRPFKEESHVRPA